MASRGHGLPQNLGSCGPSGYDHQWQGERETTLTCPLPLWQELGWSMAACSICGGHGHCCCWHSCNGYCCCCCLCSGHCYCLISQIWPERSSAIWTQARAQGKFNTPGLRQKGSILPKNRKKCLGKKLFTFLLAFLLGKKFRRSFQGLTFLSYSVTFPK